jgi:hypothetical protein
VDAGAAGRVVDQAPEQPAEADHQRHHRRRQEKEHRYQDKLGRHRVAVGDVELGPAGDHVSGREDCKGAGVERAGRIQEQGHRQGDEEKPPAGHVLHRALTAFGPRQGAVAPAREELLGVGCVTGGLHGKGRGGHPVPTSAVLGWEMSRFANFRRGW